MIRLRAYLVIAKGIAAASFIWLGWRTEVTVIDAMVGNNNEGEQLIPVNLYSLFNKAHSRLYRV